MRQASDIHQDRRDIGEVVTVTGTAVTGTAVTGTAVTGTAVTGATGLSAFH
jgi:hypothetical protein